MCGLAGIIHRGGSGPIGRELTSMLQSMKHRGPDSTGYALYGTGDSTGLVMRLKLAEQEDLKTGIDFLARLEERREQVETHIRALGGKILGAEEATKYAWRYHLEFDGDLRRLADTIEDIEGAEILSIGTTLELVKDLGDAETVTESYHLADFAGTHGIGHVRMATESDVDIRSAHPFWAYPFRDIALVHNGQLTNYWKGRRQLEHRGHRFMSDCDSELIAVYLADRLHRGYSLEDALLASIEELDGVFTYLVTTSDSLGMAKDVMAAKPMVLYESDEFIALASEEVAIRSIFPSEIDTTDPYESEVRVWHR